MQGGHQVVAYNRTPQKTDELAQEGAIATYSLSDVVEKLARLGSSGSCFRPAKIVDDHIDQLKALLSPEDIVIDGGNTYYKDDLRRAKVLADADIKYIDAGVSGGIWGLKVGYCTMVGGDKTDL